MTSFWKTLLKTYLKFALCHTILKLLWAYLKRIKSEKLWAHVKGYKTDLSAKRLKSYGRKRHDYYADSGLNFPNVPFVKLDLPIPTLLVNSPEALNWVAYEQFESITKPQDDEDVFDLLSKTMGPKSFSLIGHGKYLPRDNEIWFFQRKTLVKIFSKSILDSLFRDAFIDAGKKMQLKLSQHANSFIDMTEINLAGTMDAGYRIFLGIEADNVFNGLTKFLKDFNRANSMILSVATEILSTRAAARKYFPYPFGTITPFKNSSYTITEFFLSHYNPKYRNFIELSLQNDEKIVEIIQMAQGDKNLEDRQDVLATFIKSGADMEILKNVVRAMIMAGGETISNFLSWFFYELSANPEIQEKLYNELNEAFGDEKIPTFDEVSSEHLPYLNGCIYETSRLHPAVPTIGRRPQCDLVYSDGTVIPKGTTLAISLYGMLRNPNYYPEPNRFHPNRWIPFVQPDSTVYTNFYTGPRNCPGKDVAMFEAKLIVCMIIRKFKLELKAGEKEKITYSSSLSNYLCNDPIKQTNNLWIKPILRVSH